jgi:hypothetical protein
MKAGKGLVGLACAAIALLALPAIAGADAFVSSADGPNAEFSVAGSNGYRIDFSISADGQTSISAIKRDDSSSTSVRYDTDFGRAGRRRFEASFGRAGRVSVRFKPEKVVRDPDPSCKGGPQTIRHGTFEGTIRFDGEHGFTRFAARRVRGTVEFTPRQVCEFVEGHHHERSSPAPLETSFFASSASGSAYLTFSATSEEGEDESEFSVYSAERHGDLSITREANATAPNSAFAFDPTLSSATIAPPAPFSGSAGYQRIDDHASRWEGSLSVSLPGLGDVPLTGRDYFWSLIRTSV